MMWLTWRQFRAQAAVAFAALAVIAVVLGVTGTQLAHLYATSGIGGCTATGGDCGSLVDKFLGHYHLLQNVGNVLVAAPVLVGIFWGAPLVARELETGTYRLAWTQSVTRTRWLAVKLAVVGVASMAVVGLFSLLVTWWSSPLDRVHMDRLSAGAFGQRGIVPIAYAAFAFALGVTLGLLIRRTLPAIAATLVTFTAVRIVVTLWVRGHLIAPLTLNGKLQAQPVDGGHIVMGGSGAPPHPGDWVLSTQTVYDGGHVITGAGLPSSCLRVQVSGTVRTCFESAHSVVTYQPASRFWALQWYESALFIGAAAVLAGFCFWWIRRRSS